MLYALLTNIIEEKFDIIVAHLPKVVSSFIA